MELRSKRLPIDFVISGIGKVLLRKIKREVRGGGGGSVIWWSGSRSERVCDDMCRYREQPVQDGSGE